MTRFEQEDWGMSEARKELKVLMRGFVNSVYKTVMILSLLLEVII